jgi:hypothetical protein
LLPAFDSGEDTFGLAVQTKGLFGVGIGDDAVDGELQVNNGLEYAAL